MTLRLSKLFFTNSVTDTASIDMSIVNNSISGTVIEGGVDHDALLNFVADEHIAEGSIDHGSITGLLDDDHTIHPLLLGRSGGQVQIGDTVSGGDYTIQSTSDPTRGSIFLGAASEYDEVGRMLGINVLSPTSIIEAVAEDSTNVFKITGVKQNSIAAGIDFQKARGTTLGGAEELDDGDKIGDLKANAYNGSAFVATGSIRFLIDGKDAGPAPFVFGGMAQLRTAQSNNNNMKTRLSIDSNGRIAIHGAEELEVGLAMLDVKQDKASGNAVPVIKLTQDDFDEDFFAFKGKSDTNVDRALVDAVDFTTPGSIVGWFKINVEDTQGTNPITDGDYYMPFYSAPTA